jgi:hypothetical protein
LINVWSNNVLELLPQIKSSYRLLNSYCGSECTNSAAVFSLSLHQVNASSMWVDQDSCACWPPLSTSVSHQNFCATAGKSPVQICHTQKSWELADFLWLRKLQLCYHSALHGHDASSCHEMAQVAVLADPVHIGPDPDLISEKNRIRIRPKL